MNYCKMLEGGIKLSLWIQLIEELHVFRLIGICYQRDYTLF